MRDILFRGKNKTTGKWVYGNLIHVGDYWCILEREEDLHPMDVPYLDCEIGWIDGKATPVDPQSVGQFTDLYDKNGKKIFEGDIVKGRNPLHEDRLIYRIAYAENGFYYFDEDDVAWYPYNIEDDEAIGNIHDNPGYLEVK